MRDPGFASLAVSVARRVQRRSRTWQIVLPMVLAFGTAVVVWTLTMGGLSLRTWLALLAVTLAGVVTPIIQLLSMPSRRRRAQQAEELNMAVVAGRASHGDSPQGA